MPNKFRILLLACFALSACNDGYSSKGGELLDQAEMVPMAPPAPMMKQSRDIADSSKAAPAPENSNQNADNPSNLSFLAYRYNYTFALPVNSVKATMQAHMQTCLQAGPKLCQVLSSNSSSNEHSDFSNAYLRLRAEPNWLTNYRTQLESSVKDAKGQITNSGVSAEDLTRSILDTDARLKAQTTLRTRLEGLLETRNAELKDLLSLERELARVQGQIESATTTLNVLKKRVNMSVLDINYQTKQTAVSSGALSPIVHALKSFVREFAQGLGGVIRFLAAFLPWLIFVILPLIWFIRWFWIRLRRNRSAKP